MAAPAQALLALLAWTLSGSVHDDERHFDQSIVAVEGFITAHYRGHPAQPGDNDRTPIIAGLVDLRSWQTRYTHDCLTEPGPAVAQRDRKAVSEVLARLAASLGDALKHEGGRSADAVTGCGPERTPSAPSPSTGGTRG